MGILETIDGAVTSAGRQLARRTSRRGFLGRLAALLAGGAVLPLLPIARGARAADASGAAAGEPDPSQPEGNPQDCSYWRYCSLDGFLASCCGGTHTACPPGTQQSPITWLGTCRNPVDGTQYVISYNDCCGKNACGRCYCHRNEGDRPVYFTHRANDIDWCMGTESVVYNSTVALVVGVATRPQKK